MDLPVRGCRGDFITYHRKHIGDSSHSQTHFDVRLEKFINFSQIFVLSLDAPKLTKPFDILSMKLLFKKLDPFQDLLDFGIVCFPVDTVRKEKTVQKTMRFD